LSLGLQIKVLMITYIESKQLLRSTL